MPPAGASGSGIGEVPSRLPSSRQSRADSASLGKVGQTGGISVNGRAVDVRSLVISGPWAGFDCRWPALTLHCASGRVHATETWGSENAVGCCTGLHACQRGAAHRSPVWGVGCRNALQYDRAIADGHHNVAPSAHATPDPGGYAPGSARCSTGRPNARRITAN